MGKKNRDNRNMEDQMEDQITQEEKVDETVTTPEGETGQTDNTVTTEEDKGAEGEEKKEDVKSTETTPELTDNGPDNGSVQPTDTKSDVQITETPEAPTKVDEPKVEIPKGKKVTFTRGFRGFSVTGNRSASVAEGDEGIVVAEIGKSAHVAIIGKDITIAVPIDAIK